MSASADTPPSFIVEPITITVTAIMSSALSVMSQNTATRRENKLHQIHTLYG